MIDVYDGLRRVRHINVTGFEAFRAAARREAAVAGVSVEWRKM
jgi:hypothetical protein